VMREAWRKAGKQTALAVQIAPLIGYKPAENTISGWVTGRNMPNADVLLAAAKLSGISLDELLFGESLEARQDRLEKELEDLRRAVQGRAVLLVDEPD
jgi:transcriptional regulator with XRE-family HTH domain